VAWRNQAKRQTAAAAGAGGASAKRGNGAASCILRQRAIIKVATASNKDVDDERWRSAW